MKFDWHKNSFWGKTVPWKFHCLLESLINLKKKSPPRRTSVLSRSPYSSKTFSQKGNSKVLNMEMVCFIFHLVSERERSHVIGLLIYNTRNFVYFQSLDCMGAFMDHNPRHRPVPTCTRGWVQVWVAQCTAQPSPSAQHTETCLLHHPHHLTASKPRKVCSRMVCLLSYRCRGVLFSAVESRR